MQDLVLGSDGDCGLACKSPSSPLLSASSWARPFFPSVFIFRLLSLDLLIPLLFYCSAPSPLYPSRALHSQFS